MKNPYDILGVDKNASPEEIKKKFRSLSKEFHPDKNKSEGAEEKYKDITWAYEILSDKDKKNKYDNGGSFVDSGNFGDFGSMEDILFQFFGNRVRRRGENLKIEIFCTLEEIYSGTKKTVNYKRKVFKNGTYESEQVTKDIEIPPGFNTNPMIFQGLGNDLPNAENNSGDLYIFVEEIPHQTFVRINNFDIGYNMNLDFADFVLGCEKELTLLDGKKIKVKIKEKTQPFETLRVQQKGFKTKYHTGDLFIKLILKIRDYDDDEKELIKKLQK